MGAWNYGVFDDDTAYDALTDLKNSLDIIADMERYFDEVIQAEYIGYDEAHYALVSAAVIDSVINSFVYRCDEEDYFEWTSSQKCFDFSPLKQKAVTAIGAILSDNSEWRVCGSERLRRQRRAVLPCQCQRSHCKGRLCRYGGRSCL